MKKEKEQDLGIVVKPKMWPFWEGIKRESENELKRLEDGAVFHRAVIKMAQEKMEELEKDL